RIQLRLRNPIAGHWIAHIDTAVDGLRRIRAGGEWIVYLTQRSIGIEPLGEIALALERRGHGLLGEICGAEALPFGVREEERAIVAVVKLRQHDGTGKAPTELIALETSELDTGAIGEKIVGVHGAIAQEFVCAAVELVAA